jgi:hypothetical protein
MKISFKTILFLSLLLFARSAFGAVQEKDTVCNSTGTPATTCIVTLTSGATAGNAIVVGAAWYTSSVTLTVTDDKSDTITLLPSRSIQGAANCSAVTECLQLGYLFGVTSGAQVFTFTWSSTGSTFSAATVVEETGVNAIDGYDHVLAAGYQGNSSSPASGWVGATHDTTEIAVGLGVSATNYNWTAGAGYTLLSTATSFQLGIEDQSVSNGSYQAAFTTSGSNNWGAIQIVLYQTSGSQFVQSVDQELGTASQATPSVSTYFRNTTAGSLLFCSVLWVNNVTISTVTDTQSNTFHMLPRITVSGGGAFIQGFYALGTTGGADAISVAWNSGGATFQQPVCQEYSGVQSIDQHAEGSMSGSMTATSPSVTTVVNNELLIGYAGTTSDIAITAGTGWTARSTTHRASLAESQFLQPIGTYNSAFASGSTAVWGVGIVTFFAGNSAPHILSANSTICFIGSSCTFSVNATGTPVPSLTETGILPSAITFVDNGNGTATLSGTAASGTAGNYALMIKAHNIVFPDANQNFTLKVVANALVQEQDQKCNTTMTPVTTCTFTLTNTSGNMMFLNVAWYTGVTVAVTDTQSNTWKCLPQRAFNGGGGFYLQGCYALNIHLGSNTVTITWSGSGATLDAAALGEWTGFNAFDDYDVQTNQNNYQGDSSEATNPDSQTSAKHDSSELCIGYADYAAFTSWASGGSWTLRSTASNVQLGLEDQIVSNGTYTVDFLLGTGNNWLAGTACFYETGTAQFVQGQDHDDGVTAQATPDTEAYNVNVTSGDFLYSVYVWVNTPIINQNVPTDTLGNTWVCKAQLQMPPPSGATTGMFCYSFATHSGADTVSTSFSGSGASFIGMAHGEVSGVNMIDQYAQQTGVSTNAVSPSVVTTSPNEFILGWYVTAAGFVNWSIPVQWTARASRVRSVGVASQYLQPIGIYNSSFTTANANWAAGIITLTSTSSGGTQYGGSIQFGGSIQTK